MNTAGTGRTAAGPYAVETGPSVRLRWKHRLRSGAGLMGMVVTLGFVAAAIVGVLFVLVGLVVSAATN